jgi:pyridoxamine 5'-phosphate oxidase
MTDGIRTAEEQDDSSTLTSGDLFEGRDPFALFSEWLGEATRSEPNDPNAMALATVDEDGLPDVRMVLMKGFDAAGFVFYTNLESRKGRQLAARPKAALCFHWKSIRRQVRVRGAVQSVTPEEAEDYFATRPMQSRIGAWASQQSRPLESKSALEQAFAEHQRRFGDGKIPRPPHWSGFRIVPEELEFWRDGAFRLHDRMRFRRAGTDWTRTLLFP